MGEPQEKLEQNEPEEDVGSGPLQWLADNKILILVILIVIIILKLKMQDLRARWFAAFMNYYYKDVDAKIQEVKKDIFVGLDTIVSHDPELRKAGNIKILEIGVGTGVNLEHYPEGTHLVVVDSNPHFMKYYNENRKKFPNIQSEEIIIAKGEDMDMIPDNSVDVVVVTLVFCSVAKIEKMLKQILRVLTPGGKFYFFEHIEEFDKVNHGTRNTIQHILTRLGIWQFLFGGCELTRDILNAVEATGFSKVQAQRFYAPFQHPIFQLVQPCLKGIAEK